MKHVISWIFASGFLLTSVACVLASFGALSDQKLLPEQNQLGGYGLLCSTGNPSQNFYYDDTTFYYQASVPSWEGLFYELYAYDLETGESHSVCKRIACDHKSAACPIFRLYQNDYGRSMGYWSMIDHQFVAPHYTKDEMPIIGWDPLTNRVETIATPLRYTGVSDEEFVGDYQNFFNTAMRLTDALVLIGYDNEMHVCDNQYQEQFSFTCRNLSYPMVVGQTLYWTGSYYELNEIDLKTGKMEKNVLEGLFDTNKIVSVWEVGTGFSAFTYQDKIYFPRNEVIYAFDPAQYTVTEIASFDPLTEEEPYACFGTENVMYYKWQGMMRRMDLATGTVTDLPEMPKVPCAAVHEYLLFVSWNTTGTDDVECYDRDGKTVHP